MKIRLIIYIVLFKHIHPYPPFIPDNATKLIVGTLPPPRFTTGKLKEGDVDFCYGSRDGLLWIIFDQLFKLKLRYENSSKAVQQRKNILKERGIGICDIVASAKRKKIDASDIGMQDVQLRNLVEVLQQHPKINMLLFTGGRSKNGPEYFFRKQLKHLGLELKVVSDRVPRIHSFQLPGDGRTITTVTLTGPSGTANRAIGSIKEYKEMKLKKPSFTTIDFRVLQYKDYF